MNTLRKLSLTIPFRMYSRGNRFTPNYGKKNESYSDDDFDDFDDEPENNTNKYNNKYINKYQNDFSRNPSFAYSRQSDQNYRPYQQFENQNRQFNALSKQEKSKKIQLDPIVQEKMLQFREFTDQKLEEIYSTENVERAAALLDLYRRHLIHTLTTQSKDTITLPDSSIDNHSKLQPSDDSLGEKFVESQNTCKDSNSFILDGNAKLLENEQEESIVACDDEVPPIATNPDVTEPSYVEEIVLQEKEEVLKETQRRV